jgi:uncharacterized integral membrane protein
MNLNAICFQELIKKIIYFYLLVFLLFFREKQHNINYQITNYYYSIIKSVLFIVLVARLFSNLLSKQGVANV